MSALCVSTIAVWESAKEKRLHPWERVEAAHIELIEIEVVLWSPA
jgi:hypothetical protein